MEFSKPPKNIGEQIQLLKERGLIMSNEAQVENYLRNIGYFRLTGYFKYFQDPSTDRFKNGTSFDDVLNIYIFDRKLRLHFIDAIERIEVSFRAHLSDYMSCFSGKSHWYLDEQLFQDTAVVSQGIDLSEYAELMASITKDIDKSKALFIKDYASKYSTPSLPPSWMLVEVLPIGQIINLFRLLKAEYQKSIANEFGIKYPILASWLGGLRYLRNLCAHHERVWNKTHTWRLLIPRGRESDFPNANSTACYAKIVEELLAIIIPASSWKARYDEIIAEHKIDPNLLN